MKVEEVKTLSVEEMKAKEKELVEELFNLKLRHSTGQLENPLKIRLLRKDIARVKTIRGEKEREV